jgi:hypothetical protein
MWAEEKKQKDLKTEKWGAPSPRIIFLSLIFLSIAECRERPGQIVAAMSESQLSSRVSEVPREGIARIIPEG